MAQAGAVSVTSRGPGLMFVLPKPSICASNGRSCRCGMPSSWRQSQAGALQRGPCTRASPMRRALGALALNGSSRALQGFEMSAAPTRQSLAGFSTSSMRRFAAQADLAQLGQICPKAPPTRSSVAIVNGGFIVRRPAQRPARFCDTA